MGIAPSIVAARHYSARDPSRRKDMDYPAGGSCWIMVSACPMSISKVVASFGGQTTLLADDNESRRLQHVEYRIWYVSETLTLHGGGHGRCASQQTIVGKAHTNEGKAYDAKVRKSLLYEVRHLWVG